MEKNNLFTDMRIFGRNIFYGNEKFTSIFSYEGVLNRPLSWAIACILNMFLQIVSWLNIEVITYLFGFVIFYCVLALVQKRCRDFGSSGTFWVIYASILMLLESFIFFFDVDMVGELYIEVEKLEKILYCFLIILLLIPSKTGVDMKLHSSLLKYPLLYVFICFILSTMMFFILKFIFI